jgi:hypothetical protein
MLYLPSPAPAQLTGCIDTCEAASAHGAGAPLAGISAIIASVSLTGWLHSRLGIPSPDELKGIHLAAEDALEFPAPRSLALLIRAIEVMPVGSVLYLEGGAHPPDLQHFLAGRQVLQSIRVGRHTIWPRQSVHHLPMDPSTIEQLARFAETVAGPELCMHLVVYCDAQVLVSAHDAPSDPVLVNKNLPSDVLESFAGRLNVSRNEIKPAR